MLKKVVLVSALSIVMAGCSGMRTTEETFMTHAENINFLFFQIPGGDTQERAMELIPPGGKITTMLSSPTDTTSAAGFFNRLIGIDATTINGTIEK